MPFVYLNVPYVCVLCMCVLCISSVVRLLFKILSSILNWVGIPYKNAAVTDFNSHWLAGAVPACL